MKKRLKRWLFEPDGLGVGWRLAWWLPLMVGLFLEAISKHSRSDAPGDIAIALFAASGVATCIFPALVMRYRRRNGWTKLNVDGRWRWLRPGESPEDYEDDQLHIWPDESQYSRWVRERQQRRQRREDRPLQREPKT